MSFASPLAFGPDLDQKNTGRLNIFAILQTKILTLPHYGNVGSLFCRVKRDGCAGDCDC